MPHLIYEHLDLVDARMRALGDAVRIRLVLQWADRAVRVNLAELVELAGYGGEAAELRALPAIRDVDVARETAAGLRALSATTSWMPSVMAPVQMSIGQCEDVLRSVAGDAPISDRDVVARLIVVAHHARRDQGEMELQQEELAMLRT